MRIVKAGELHKLRAHTLIATYTPQVFGEIEVLTWAGEPKPDQWLSVISYTVFDVESGRELGEIELKDECTSRDTIDPDELFAVFNDDDLDLMIKILTRCKSKQ